MTREEFSEWIDEPEDDVQDTVDTLFEYVQQLQKENDSLEEQNTELQHTIKQDNDLIASQLHKIEDLQARIKELEEPKTCESCDFCGEDCSVLELLMSQFGFEVENCICPNYGPKKLT